jgi:hypothetical protein
MAPPCFGTVASFEAATQNSSTCTFKPNAPRNVTFVAGKCVCKTCRAKDLTFYRYLDDAKCDGCGQWQNEEPIPD